MGTLIRTAMNGGVASAAVYSDCGAYRYALTRVWDPSEPLALFVMLNPSTASEVQNDPTVARCESRARSMRYGGLAVANLFGWRSTDPAALRRALDPVGPENDAHLSDLARKAKLVICAWGNNGALQGRSTHVARALRDWGCVLHHLGLTGRGQPSHPLYLPATREPQPWDQAAISVMSDAERAAPPVTTPIG